MARDMVATMHALEFESFHVVGHDRGGRIAYRMALDHQERIESLAVLDIVPTGEMFRRADMAFGLGYWHWFFLAQRHDLPERVIGVNTDGFSFHRGRDVFTPEAMAECKCCYDDPAAICQSALERGSDSILMHCSILRAAFRIGSAADDIIELGASFRAFGLAR